MIIDARGLHGLACRKSAPRHVRHSQLNDVIWRTVKKTQTPANEKPVTSRWETSDCSGPGSFRGHAENRWHGTSQSQTPMPRHTYHLRRSQLVQPPRICCKQDDKVLHHLVNPFVGSHRCGDKRRWCSESAEFIEDLGRRITLITGEPLETTYLFERISVTLQWGDAVAFRNTFPVL